MRKWSPAIVAIIVGVALYFAVTWGSEGVSMLTSPAYGLDDVWHAQAFFAIGHYFGLAPTGLMKLAAFFATLKLAVAVICAVHIFERLRGVVIGKADTEILEAGLILIVLVSIALVGPAVWSHNEALVREAVLQLVLAAAATALCMVERIYPHEDETSIVDVTPRDATPFRIWR
jgi:hypothetical protein